LNQYRSLAIPLYDGNTTASDDSWGRLYALLAQDSLLAGYNILLNENGQVIDRRPEDLASTLKTGGGRPTIWIDYCGWPLYYKAEWWTFGQPIIWESGRFAQFVRAANNRLLAGSQPTGADGRITPLLAFEPPHQTRYRYPVGLSINTDLLVAPWQDDLLADGGGFWPNLSEERASGEKWGGFDQYTYASFAIRVGKGWYIWAYGRPDGPCVTPEGYARFIHWLLALPYWNPAGGGTPEGPPWVPPDIPPTTGNDPGTGTPPDAGIPPAPASSSDHPSTWWGSRSPAERVALIGGGLALVAGAALLLHRPTKPEG
jgi:hypothetical protein